MPLWSSVTGHTLQVVLASLYCRTRASACRCPEKILPQQCSCACHGRNGFDMIQSQPLRSSFQVKLINSFTFSSFKLMFKIWDSE